MKVKCICFNKNIIRIKTGEYDESTNIIRIKQLPIPHIPIIRQKVEQIKAKPEHIYYTRKGLVFLVNEPKRRTFTINDGDKPDFFEPDLFAQNVLDYLVERNFWEALMLRIKTPLFPLIMSLIGGMGLGVLITLMFIRLGMQNERERRRKSNIGKMG